MRDMTIAARVGIIVVLLISLLLLMRQCGSDSATIKSDSEDQAIERDADKDGLTDLGLYPDLPATMPDLNDGYIFNEERFLEASDLDDPILSRGGSDDIDIEEVVYSGSIITGDLQKALIAYQEAAPVKRSAGRPARSRKQQRSAKTAYKHKQLEVGEVFKGFKVVSIEKDRIVFEKGKEKIEKFLFDASKERVVIKSSSPSTPAEPASRKGAANVVPPLKIGAGAKPPKATVPSSAAFRLRTPAIGPDGKEQPTVPPNVRKRRSQQRLLGIDPSFVAPQPPGGTN